MRMIRSYILIFAVILVAGAVGGFGSAAAQSIFNKVETPASKASSKSGEKPSLFIKPKPSTATAKQSAVKYGEKAIVSQLKKDSELIASTLEDWKAAGRGPETAEEIKAYAQAHRAVAIARMAKRTQEYYSYIQKQEAKGLRSKIASTSSSALEVQSSAKASDDAPKAEAKKKTKSVYVRPKTSKADSAAPTKVFTGYR